MYLIPAYRALGFVLETPIALTSTSDLESIQTLMNVCTITVLQQLLNHYLVYFVTLFDHIIDC